MADTHAALAYAKELYASEMEWHRAYEEKVLRYQTLSGAVLGAGALGLSNVQFAVHNLIATPIGIAFVAAVVITGAAAMCGILASLRAMAAVTINRPPATEEILDKLAEGENTMWLARGFTAAADEIRKFNVRRGHLVEWAWRAATTSVVGGACCLVLGVFVPWPVKGC